MKSMILKTAAGYLLPILLLFSFFLLIRGHNSPGGGFVGGLIASIAFVLHSFANGVEKTLKVLKYNPLSIIAVGLALSATSMFLPVFFGKPVMTSLWMSNEVPVFGLVGTTLFFDTGIYVLVVGTVLTILFTISKFSE